MSLVREFLPRPAPDVLRIVRVGIDVGQRVDPSAIVVAEVEERIHGRHVSEAWDPITGDYIKARRQTFYVVRHVERLPIGTSYPGVAARIVEVVASLNEIIDQPNFEPYLMVDLTGVGRPLFDLLRQALAGHRYRISGATITSGERLAEGVTRHELSVGKAYLVSRTQALMQTGRIKLPDTDEARQLGQELKDFQINVTERGTFTAGAKSGSHDDLVIALCLAVLLPLRTHPVYEIIDAADF